MRTVLISAAGTGTAFGIAARLRASWGSSVKLVTADINPAHLVSSSLLSDAHYQVPKADQDEFASAIMDIIRQERVGCYIPLLNAEIEVAEWLSRLLPDVDVWSSPLAAKLCGNKAASEQWLASIDIPVPTSFVEGSWENAKRYFVKPKDGFGSRNTAVMTGRALKALPAAERAGLFVQEVCDPPEVTVDSFFDAERRRGRAVVRERIETKAGVCTKARIFEDNALSEYARRIGEALQQRGAICFQAMRVSGDWAITDLNFRAGAGTAMTCAAGVDLLSASFACRWGEDYDQFLQTRLAEEGVFVTRQYAELVMLSS